jgi:hypothetical protein
MKVINNFLPEKDFSVLKNIFIGESLPWHLTRISPGNFKDFQNVHYFITEQKITSNYYNLLNPIIKLIDPFILLRVKANLIIKGEKIIEHGMHIDYRELNENCNLTTGILYMNSNDGYTKFENGEKILSEENKFIEFDGELMHTGTNCTDQPFRIVINFNYIKRNAIK